MIDGSSPRLERIRTRRVAERLLITPWVIEFNLRNLARMIASFLRRVVPEGFRPIGYLTHLVRRRCAERVRLGPFAGMRYIDYSIGSAYLPKLLGTYERELLPTIEQECARRPGLIVDLGAAEGYYAVGLALRNPEARVVAFESAEDGRAALLKMAKLNGVRGQIEIRGHCAPPDLQSVLESRRDERTPVPNPRNADFLPVPDHPAFILCDVEGDERFLLDPFVVPSLQRAAILVETHEFIYPGITEALCERFGSTHRVQLIWQTLRSRADFPFHSLGTRLIPKSYLDWAVSEWRPIQMCWLWMQPYD
jgi:hypothetical protein